MGDSVQWLASVIFSMAGCRTQCTDRHPTGQQAGQAGHQSACGNETPKLTLFGKVNGSKRARRLSSELLETITNKAKAGLTFTAAALICLRLALHAGAADVWSGIQTRQWDDRWVMQCDDRAQTAAALFLYEDSVCHTSICTTQIHPSRYRKAEHLLSFVLVDIWNYRTYGPCYSSATCRVFLDN